MDAERFDRLARTLSGVRDRRTALRAAVGGVLSGVAALTAADAGAKNRNQAGDHKQEHGNGGGDKHGNGQPAGDGQRNGKPNHTGGSAAAANKKGNGKGKGKGKGKPGKNGQPNARTATPAKICNCTNNTPNANEFYCNQDIHELSGDKTHGSYSCTCGDPGCNCPDASHCCKAYQEFCQSGQGSAPASGQPGQNNMCCNGLICTSQTQDYGCGSAAHPSDTSGNVCCNPGEACVPINNKATCCPNDKVCNRNCCKANEECFSAQRCVCKQNLVCGAKCCDVGQTCQNGTCTSACQPESDKQACEKAGSTCGTVKNNCGKDVNCGECTNGFECQNNKTCVCPNHRVTCKDVCCPAGKTCDGGVCTTPCIKNGDVCDGGGCCKPFTCKNGKCQTPLLLTYIVDCDPTRNTFRIINQTSSAIDYTYDDYNSSLKGSGTAPANAETYFDLPAGNQTVRLFVDGVLVQTKASGGNLDCGSGKVCCTAKSGPAVCEAGNCCVTADCTGDKTCNNHICTCPNDRVACEGICCTVGQTCEGGTCTTPCVPDSKDVTCRNKCGTVTNNCGQPVNCGDCTDGFTCTDNTCTCPSRKLCQGVCCESNRQVCKNGTGACCTPITTCPANACGQIDDGCGGMVSCGECKNNFSCDAGQCVCKSGKVCAEVCCDSGNDVCKDGNGVCCTPKTRQQVCTAGVCETVSDGCGGTIDCGACANGNTCQNNQCVCAGGNAVCNDICCTSGQICNTTGGACCTPSDKQQTCNGKCGSVTDNCGQTIDCGPCDNDFTCNPRSQTCVCTTNQVCSGVCCTAAGAVCDANTAVCCVPRTKAEVCTPGVCQRLSDGCGRTIDCGGCTDGNLCLNNQCVCADGNAVCKGVCCAVNQVCDATGGACCTPKITTCPANSCGPVNTGCGTIDCGSCALGGSCVNSTCQADVCKTVNQGCTDANPCCAGLVCQNGVCNSGVNPACAPRGKDCTDNPCCNSADTCESNASGTVNVCKQASEPNPKPKPDEPKCAKNGERPRNGAKCCGRLHENHGRCRTNRWERCNKADRRQPNCGCDRVTRCKHDRRGGESCQGR